MLEFCKNILHFELEYDIIPYRNDAVSRVRGHWI